MDWSWKGSLSGRICPRDGEDWWWQALGMDKAFWKSNTIILLYATIHYPFSHNHGSVENHPTRKETIILEIHPIFSTEKTMIMGERVAFSLFQTVYETWGTPYPPNVAEFFFLWSSGETRILWREVSWHATLVKSCGLKRVPKTIGSWGGREKFGRLLQMSLCSGVVFVDYSIKLGVAWKTHERIQPSMKTVQPVCSNYNICFFRENMFIYPLNQPPATLQ